jgi:hypothetical protein
MIFFCSSLPPPTFGGLEPFGLGVDTAIDTEVTCDDYVYFREFGHVDI